MKKLNALFLSASLMAAAIPAHADKANFYLICYNPVKQDAAHLYTGYTVDGNGEIRETIFPVKGKEYTGLLYFYATSRRTDQGDARVDLFSTRQKGQESQKAGDILGIYVRDSDGQIVAVPSHTDNRGRMRKGAELLCEDVTNVEKH